MPITSSGRGGFSPIRVTGTFSVFPVLDTGIGGTLLVRGVSSLRELESLENIESTRFISCLAP